MLQACVVTLTQLAWVFNLWFASTMGVVYQLVGLVGPVVESAGICLWLPTCTIWNACLCCVVWGIYLAHCRFGSHAWLHTHNWCGCTETIQWWWWWMLCLWVEVVDVGLGH